MRVVFKALYEESMKSGGEFNSIGDLDDDNEIDEEVTFIRNYEDRMPSKDTIAVKGPSLEFICFHKIWANNDRFEDLDKFLEKMSNN